MQGVGASRGSNQTLVAGSPGGGPPSGVSSGSIHDAAGMGSFIHTGQPHKVSAHRHTCLVR